MKQKRINIERRGFLKAGSAAVATFALASRAATSLAQGAKPGPHVDEKDPAAQALGYRHDATKVDKAKYAQYKAGELCANCQQFQGKTGDAWGPCTIFPGKQVNAKGWCSAYSKKA